MRIHLKISMKNLDNFSLILNLFYLGAGLPLKLTNLGCLFLDLILMILHNSLKDERFLNNM